MGSAIKRSAPTKSSQSKKLKTAEKPSIKKSKKAAPAPVSESESEDDLDQLSSDSEAEVAELMSTDSEAEANSDANSDSEAEAQSEDELDHLDNSDDDAQETTEGQEQAERDPNKKTSKEAHQEQKRLLKERKLARPLGEKIVHLKQLWEKLRVKRELPADVRKKLVEEIWEITKDNIKDLVFKHDSTRIIQTIFKYADKSKRVVITKSLQGSYYELAKSSYGKYLLVKILHYGSKEVRVDVLNELHGKFKNLMRHKEGAYVIEDAYKLYSNASQKKQIIREFFGSEFAVFRDAGKDMSLNDIIIETPDKRPIIMKNLFDTIKSCVTKGSIGFNIIHAAMLEFVKNMNSSEKEEFIDLVTEQFAEIVHTVEGSQVARYCLALATAKERKGLVRSLKPHVKALANDEYGNKVLITLFETVDDTVLVGKSFTPEFSENMSELIVSKYGRRPFLFLLLGRCNRYFTKIDLDEMAIFDELKKTTSKKDDLSRIQELNKLFAPIILNTIKTDCKELLLSNFGAQYVAEALLYAAGDKAEALKAVAAAFGGSTESSLHLIHEPFTGRTLRALIQEGHWNNKEKKVVTIEEPTGFKNLLVEQLSGHLEQWATGDGSFVVVSLLENLGADEKKQLAKGLKKYVRSIQTAAEEGNKGSALIVKALA
ncbi:ARM repeat-containing protein [Nadsonia fulvescens var. elongata DSM 6958]|uniref:ARM repeat-containing protein n=1 Tax=Nadsonia fulvescens var. elongata DSM 6958 TaxID=857566 RepID=A0A1E3PSA9_9ASCO|nr:ARM repeat-containing protein [Nadsonia fulvescens var. elongata DSM 6958]